MTRFICSQDRTEIEAVKKELFLSGIRSEIRSNPLAQALRVTRLELWLEDERDLFNASKLYAGIQGRNGGKAGNSANSRKSEPAEVYVEVDDPPRVGGRDTKPGRNSGSNGQEKQTAEPDTDTLMHASALLEKEIEAVLQRESELAGTCASLHTKLNSTAQELSRAQADLAREGEAREAAEKKQSTELVALRDAVERERAARNAAEEQLQREKTGREEALKTVQAKLDKTLQQLQTQQIAVVELRKEIVSNELQLKEQEKMLSKARAEVLVEREARAAAEAKEERASSARTETEQRLAQEKQRQAEAFAESLNSLRARLQAKRPPASPAEEP